MEQKEIRASVLENAELEPKPESINSISPSNASKLKTLESLRDDGIITEEEFQKQKAEILEREQLLLVRRMLIGWHQRELIMKSLNVIVVMLCIIFGADQVTADQVTVDPESGYQDTVDQSGPQDMRDSLHEIIDDHTRIPYTSIATDTWDVLEIADENQDDFEPTGRSCLITDTLPAP